MDDLGIETATEASNGVDRMGSLRLLLALGGRGAGEAEVAAMATRRTHFVQMIERVTPADLLPGADRLLTGRARRD